MEELDKKLVEVVDLLRKADADVRMPKTFEIAFTIVATILGDIKDEFQDSVRARAYDAFALMMLKSSDVTVEYEEVEND